MKRAKEEDPRAELVEKLLEYKMYKYMSFELRDMELDAAKSFYREKDVPREVEAYRPPLDYNELLKDMTLAKLQEIFEGILKRQEDKKDPVRSNFGRIEKDEVSVDQKRSMWKILSGRINGFPSGHFWKNSTARSK